MPITLNFTGLRVTDAIAGVLSTNRAAYTEAGDVNSGLGAITTMVSPAYIQGIMTPNKLF